MCKDCKCPIKRDVLIGELNTAVDLLEESMSDRKSYDFEYRARAFVRKLIPIMKQVRG